MKKMLFSLILILSIRENVNGASAKAAKPQQLSSKEFLVCGKKLELEVARSEGERSMGLMHRDGIKTGTGMIFIFEESRPLQFWMKNVPFDIDIAYFNEKGKLLNSLTMKGTSPLTLDNSLEKYPSLGSARYAIEVEKDFFKKINTKNCTFSPLP